MRELLKNLEPVIKHVTFVYHQPLLSLHCAKKDRKETTGMGRLDPDNKTIQKAKS